MIGYIMKLVGKENFSLDSRIGKVYMMRLFWKYGWMMIRGRICATGYHDIANNVFIGRKVILYCKKYMSVGRKTKLHDGVKIDALSTDGVKIGDNVVLGKNTIIECTGSLQDVGKGVVIGDRTTFGNDCFFGAAGGIVVGNDVVAGQYIRFHSENHNYADRDLLIREQGVIREGIKIGNNCWIGSGVVFLDGAELGDGCVVGANAVVSGKFEENSVIVGIPARTIKKRF